MLSSQRRTLTLRMHDSSERGIRRTFSPGDPQLRSGQKPTPKPNAIALRTTSGLSLSKEMLGTKPEAAQRA